MSKETMRKFPVKSTAILCGLILPYFAICEHVEGLIKQSIKLQVEDKDYTLCGNLSLACIVDPPGQVNNIIWEYNGTPLNFTSNEKIATSTHECSSKACAFLNITCLGENNVGNYSCHLSDSDIVSNETSEVFQLKLKVPGMVVKKAANGENISTNFARVNATMNITLMCAFSGMKLHNFKWAKENEKMLPIFFSPTDLLNTNDSYSESYLHVQGIRNNNGTYVCSANDGPNLIAERISLLVMDAPLVTIHMVKVTGARQIFLNWTISDGNAPITEFFLQLLKNNTQNWMYYNENIKTENNSYIIRNLEPNTAYKIRIQAKNNFGESPAHEYDYVTTLSEDPEFLPELTLKAVGPHSINVGWSYPSDIKGDIKDHVHYYKLLIHPQNGTPKEAIQHADGNNFYMFQNLNVATTYFFKIAACNEYTHECGNWSKVISGTTMDGEAGPPENVSIACKYDDIIHSSSINVSWSPPKNPNGEIVHYLVILEGYAIFQNENDMTERITFGPSVKTTINSSLNTQFDMLPRNTNYTVRISGMTRSRGGGKQAVQTCYMPPTIPDRDKLTKFNWGKVDENGQWLFKLYVPPISSRNGAICCYRIFVVRLEPGKNVADLPPPEESVVSSYNHVHRERNGGTYMADMIDLGLVEYGIFLGDGYSIITNSTDSECNKCNLDVPKTLSTFKTTSIPSVTTTSLNDQIPMEDFRNIWLKSMKSAPLLPSSTEGPPPPPYVIYDGPLDINSNYTGFVQVIVYGKDKFIPAYSSYFTILKPGPQVLQADNSAELMAILFQILCGMVAISIMMLAVFCLLHHYTKQVAETQGVEMTLRNSFRHLCRSLRGSHIPVSSNPPDVMPISKVALLSAFAELAKDSDYGFEQEFELLPDRFTDRTTKASEARENASKNRYPDIKAYDQTRVKLSQVDGIVGSDYINANFVVSYKERKKFICAQGPMESTVCDFWRMIWEQHLEIVLMLTNLEEYSKTKCAKYWPDKEEEKKTFGDITIHYANEKRYSGDIRDDAFFDYMVRELKMVKAVPGGTRDPEERVIFQYHFLVWKDFQAPEHPSTILKFIRRVNEAYSLEKGPILVHCSAGVGRTGTLVAIDSLIQQLENEGQILIFNAVCDLRHQRNFLVQSLKQYIFVYRALVEYAQFGNTEIKAADLKSGIEKLKQRENGKLKSKMEEEYDKLTFTINHHEHKPTSVASAAENAVKNRSASIIPYDRNRVILTPIPGRDNSTYINATFIEGYDNSETFIITQDPIPDVTVADFWRMISEQNIQMIIMLSSYANENQKKLGKYWPDDEAVYGAITVKYIRSESCPYYTRREFDVCNMDESLVVMQYQYNGWPTVEGEVPEVTRGMIELMDNTVMDESAAPPIVIHCEQGSDRSSMFVALSILAQQVKTERRVDVFTTVRKLKSQRQGMLTKFAQYEFLYRAILNYGELHRLLGGE